MSQYKRAFSRTKPLGQCELIIHPIDSNGDPTPFSLLQCIMHLIMIVGHHDLMSSQHVDKGLKTEEKKNKKNKKKNNLC